MTLATGAYLWGSGYDLVSSTALSGSQSDARSAAAWLALIALLLLGTHPCLRLAIGLLRGRWWPDRLAWRATRQQRRDRDRIIRRNWVPVHIASPTALADEAFAVIVEILQANGLRPPALPRERLASHFARASGILHEWPPDWAKLEWVPYRVARDVVDHLAETPGGLGEGASHRVNMSFLEEDLRRALNEFLTTRIPVAGTAALSFPLSGELLPTALGNAEAAVADRVHRRYGLDLGLAWPRIAALPSEAEQRRLADAQRRADTTTALAAGWLLAAVGLVLTISASLARGLLSVVLLVAVLGTLAFFRTSYRQAVVRTVAHGRLVEAVVDLKRLPMLDALGWRRPRSPEDERALFSALSAALAGGPAEARFQRYCGTTTRSEPGAEWSAALAETIDGLGRELPEAVTASVLGGVERGLSDTLEPAVERTLQRTLAGPELDNFDGHLSVMLVRDGVVPVEIDDTLRALLDRDRPYELVVAVGHLPTADATTAPVRIRGGNDRHTVEFGVSVDSNVPALRQGERSIVVRPDSDDKVRFPVGVGHTVAESAWLWVRVTQHGRTIQNLVITLVAMDQRS
ncbi:hypothetical protein [Kitasatospora sp. NPDC097691]|uniref:hypothetical protein n=1 Tax=Kitasatospora sp. NPDC097691 TaxID=3157231 RepID=UPI003317B2B3